MSDARLPQSPPEPSSPPPSWHAISAAQPAQGGPVAEETVCVQCKYALKGLMRDGACPECGTAIALSLRIDVPLPIVDGVVTGDTRCGNCFTSLRSLRTSEVCPACSFPVEKAVLASRLATSNEAWLETLQRGCTLLQLGALAQLGWLLYVLGCFISVRSSSWNRVPVFNLASAAGFVVVLAGWACMQYGLVLCTKPDSSLPATAKYNTLVASITAQTRWAWCITPLAIAGTFAYFADEIAFDRFGHGRLSNAVHVCTFAMIFGRALTALVLHSSIEAWSSALLMLSRRCPVDSSASRRIPEYTVTLTSANAMPPMSWFWLVRTSLWLQDAVFRALQTRRMLVRDAPKGK